MNIFSAFDGYSSAQIALTELGIKYDAYFASEICPHAIKVTQSNFANTIQLGDITKIDCEKLPKIDLLCGGSPCQGFSIAGKGLNFEDPRSKLFFEFVKLKKQLSPQYFFLENVVMEKKYENLISDILQCEPLFINSCAFSAQNRKRLYWTNIPFEDAIPSNNLKIRDILSDNHNPKLILNSEFIEKQCIKPSVTDRVRTLNPRTFQGKQTYQHDRIYDANFKFPSLNAQMSNRNRIFDGKNYRFLSIREQARLQTIPDWFDFSSVSDLAASHMIGNGWTIEVIKSFFRNLGKGQKIEQRLMPLFSVS
jgi:site-specific DNA-cytosine methylase